MTMMTRPSLCLLLTSFLCFVSVANTISVPQQQQRQAQQEGNNNNTGNETTTTTTTTSSTPGNCVAGGSGYGLAFDYTRADVVSLHWTNIPKERITVEFWFKNTDPFSTEAVLFSYSAFNMNGYQNQGDGEVFESANELTFFISPNRMTLWRESASECELTNEMNSKVGESFVDGKWHHYAFAIDSANGGSANFYLDGHQLDFGTVLLEGIEESSYRKLPYSSDWDVAEHPDATEYYGDIETRIRYIENPCAAESFESVASMADDTAVATLLKPSLDCSDYEKATIAAAMGATFVIFQRDESAPDEDLESTAAEGAANDLQQQQQQKLSVPIISVSFSVGEEIRERETPLVFRRLRDPTAIGPKFGQVIEENGVLTLGQEPDIPWGDFDRFQATNGIYDELRVWDIVRTHEDIQSHYKTSIDVENDSDAVHLNLYYTFDDLDAQGESSSSSPSGAGATTTDFSPLGLNPGLVGALPTIKNQFTYANGEPPRTPTQPDWITTPTCPLVGLGEVIVPAAAGTDVVVELKSFDPDGEDLETRIVSEPALGSIHLAEEDDGGSVAAAAFGEVALKATDLVVDTNRKESKRVVFRTPENFDAPTTFEYSVQDGGTPVIATVRLVPHVLMDPIPSTKTVQEDTLTFFSLAKPSQLTQENMRVVVTALPEHGTLFQAQFSPGKNLVYSSLPTEVDQYGPMEVIGEVGTYISNSRGILMYIPDENGFSDPVGSIYESFGYKFVDTAARLESSEALIGLIVESENDSPEFDASNFGEVIAVQTTGSRILELESFDVDAHTLENFAERSFARITQFPTAGQLFQYTESVSNHIGEYIDPVEGVPQVFAWASKVVRYSSQYSQCGQACYSFNNPVCPEECTATGWAAEQILGLPDTYPTYADSKQGWDLATNDHGLEFIELEFPFEMFISGIELYETFKPGSVWRVSTTDSYVDDVSVHCARPGLQDGVPLCSQDTEWQTLWSQPQESITPGPEAATIFSPPLCPSTKQTKIIRIDIDTSRVPGWQSFDAVKVVGSLEKPPGLVDDTRNRLLYVPRPGVHGNDHVSFAFSDCLSEGQSHTVPLIVSIPAQGEFSANVFFEQDIFLVSTPGEVIEETVDFTAALTMIADVLGREPEEMVATVWHSDALGSRSGEVFPNRVSLSEPEVTIDLGVGHYGTPHAHVEIWLTDHSAEGRTTFRLKYRLLLCENGAIVNDLAINGRNVCVVENDNLLSTGILAFGYVATGISWLLSLFFLGWIFKYRRDNVVKVSQIEFLVLICIGAIISSSTIIALSFQAESGEDTTAASIGCTTAPFLYTIGWVLQYSSLGAKTFRLHKIMHSHKRGQAETVTFWSMFQIVLCALTVDVAIVIAWTVKNPLVYEREEVGRDIDVENGLIIIRSVGQCTVRDEEPSIWAFAGPLIGFHIVLLAAANILLLKVSNMKDRYQESKYITMATVLMLEIIVVGVPLLVALQDSPVAVHGVMVAFVSLHDIGILCFIFVPKILFQMKGPEKENDHVESIILASFKKVSNSRWDEAIETVHELLMPDSETRSTMSMKQTERLQDVKTLLVQGIQGNRDANTMHIPTGLFGSKRKFGASVSDNVRFVLKEFGGVNFRSTAESSMHEDTSSSVLDESFRISGTDEDMFILPEFHDVNQRKALLKLLSWSSLKQWNFSVFDVDQFTNGHTLLFIGWAILGAPYAQFAMAKACGQSDLKLEDFKGYNFVGSKSESSLRIPIQTLCDYLRVIESDYMTENPYHNEIHAADVLQTVHALVQMNSDVLQTTDEDLFSILLSAVVHDVGHPGKNNAFQINACSSLAMIYNDSSVLENRHASHAFMTMLGMNETGQPDHRDLNILRRVSKSTFSSIRSKVIKAILHTDMSEHFRFVNLIKGLSMSIQDGHELSRDDTWNILQYILHVADISSQAKTRKLAEPWAHRCIAEFFEQGDKEAEMGFPISPNCDRRSTKVPDSQVGFITYVVQPTFEVLAMIIPEVRERILPIITENKILWERERDGGKKQPEQPVVEKTTETSFVENTTEASVVENTTEKEEE